MDNDHLYILHRSRVPLGCLGIWSYGNCLSLFLAHGQILWNLFFAAYYLHRDKLEFILHSMTVTCVRLRRLGVTTQNFNHQLHDLLLSLCVTFSLVNIIGIPIASILYPERIHPLLIALVGKQISQCIWWKMAVAMLDVINMIPFNFLTLLMCCTALTTLDIIQYRVLCLIKIIKIEANEIFLENRHNIGLIYREV